MGVASAGVSWDSPWHPATTRGAQAIGGFSHAGGEDGSGHHLACKTTKGPSESCWASLVANAWSASVCSFFQMYQGPRAGLP